MSSTANMYRVGDYVFFEINTASPFQIRRIEELNKTPSGNVEAKVMCFYRRRDIGQALLKVIDGRSTAATTGDSSSNSGSENSTTPKAKQSDATPTETTAAATADSPPKAESDEKMDTESLEKPEPAKESTSPKKSEESTTPKKSDESTTPKKPEEISEEDKGADDTKPKSESTPIEPEKEKEKEKESDDDKTDQEEKKEQEDKKATTPEKSRARSSSPATEKDKQEGGRPGATSAGVAMPGEEKLTEPEKHRLLHRELFLSRQIETLPATHIRGKCTVTLLNELETPESYLNKEDSFFYSLVYDPAQKTILADKGEIRVGDKYQAVVPDSVLSEEDKKTDRLDKDEFESMIFHPYHGLTDRQIDQFLLITRAVGTLARAFDMNSATKYAGLHTTVAAASRDVTLFQSMILLNQAEYDIAKASSFLVPPAQKQWYPMESDRLTSHSTANLGGPLMCRDQMEEWSAAESNLFEEALEKYGKDFNDIRQDFLPWKSLRDIVEYYYMWKTTDRYIQQKRVKAAEAESRLKQVYIPTYAKPNPNAIGANSVGFKKSCEGCSAENTEQWYAWGPVSSQLRLCKECWAYWKKYGGLKRKHKLENFDKLMASQPQDSVHSGVMMPRPGDRLDMPDFGGRVQRCSLPGCSMQFANLQTLNQHLRRDHGLPWTGQDSTAANAALRPAAFGAATNTTSSSGTPPLHFAGMQTGPMRNGPRTRAPVFLRTTLYTKAARRLAPKQLHNPRHAARNPFDPINAQAIRAYCQAQPPQKIQKMARVLVKMGLASASAQSAASYNVQKPQQPQAHQQQTGAAASGRSSGQVHGKPGHPNVATVAPIQRQQQPPQKRPAGGAGAGGQPPKRYREHEAAAERGGDALFVKWINTPDDYYFHRTKKTKLIRRVLTTSILRKMGRQPYRMHSSTAKLLAKYGMIVDQAQT